MPKLIPPLRASAFAGASILATLATGLFPFTPQAKAAAGASDIDAIFESWPTSSKRMLYVRLPMNAPGSIAPFGNDTNPGTSEATAFSSIQRALNEARPLKQQGIAVKIIIGPGTHRPGSTSDTFAFALTFNPSATETTNAPLIIEGAGWSPANPANTGDVIISGSDIWSGTSGPASIANNAGWEDNGDGTWSKAWPYAFGVPSRINFHGISASYGVSDALLRREQVHVNGTTYYCINPPSGYINQESVLDANGNPKIGPSYYRFSANDSTSLNNVNGGRLTPSEGSFWVRDAVLNADMQIVTMGTITVRPPTSFNFADVNNVVEVTTKRGLMQIFMDTAPSFNTNIIIRNLTFQHAASRPALMIQGQNNVLIEDCRFLNSKSIGVNIDTGSFAPGSGSKNITLRRVVASGNGVRGAGMGYTTNALLEDCSFNYNARQAEILGFIEFSGGGIKLLKTTDATLLRSEARHNREAGFWWDIGNKNAKAIECISTNNSDVAAYIEANTSVGNSFSSSTSSGINPNGIPDLGTTPTVSIIRSVIADNGAPEGTETFRSVRSGQGVWLKENENAVLDGNIIVNNSIQIATNDSPRGEVRRNIIRNNIIVAGAGQRLYAYGNRGPSQPTINAVNSGGSVVKTMKGSWFALFDSLTSSTNDNIYYYPSQTAFPARSQTDGTTVFPAPSLTLSEWTNADRFDITNALLSNNRVDSRSSVISEATFDRTRPLLSINPLVSGLTESSQTTAIFRITRVALPETGYTQPLVVNYTVRNSPGDAINGQDFLPLSGSITIPANERSSDIVISPTNDAVFEGDEPVVILLQAGAYHVANSSANILMIDSSPAPNGTAAIPAISPTPETASIAPIVVSISSPNSGVTIRYTTDGSTPGANSGEIYAGPFTLSSFGSTTVKAIAYGGGYDPSVVATTIYRIEPQIEMVTARASVAGAPGATASRSVLITNNTGTTRTLNLALNLPGTPYLNNTYRIITASGEASTETWKSIAATGTSIWNYTSSGFDDSISASLNLGFSIPFFGSNFTTIRACTNGFASFTSSSTEWNNSPLANVTSSQPNTLFALWDDLVIFDNLSRVYHQQRTEANGPEFVIQWDNLKQIGNELRFTFQIILRPSGDVIYLYNATPANYASSTTGIIGASSAEIIQLNHNAASSLTNSGSSIRIYRPWAYLSSSSLTLGPGESRTVDIFFASAYLPSAQQASAFLSVTPVDSGLSVSADIPVSLRAGTFTAVQQWRYRFFGEIDGIGSAADSADPDGDGITNTAEFTAGTDPTITNAASYVFTGAIATNNNWGNAASWSPVGPPEGRGVSATVTPNAAQNSTIQLGQQIRIGTLLLGDSSPTTAGSNNFNQINLASGSGGSLVFDTFAGNALISRPDIGNSSSTYNGQVDTISANLTLNRPIEVRIGNSAHNGGITLSGVISGIGGVIRSFSSGGTPASASTTSTLRLTNPASSFAGVTRISGGRIEITGNVSANANGPLGNSGTSVVIGDSSTNGTDNTIAAEFALLAGTATSNHVFSRNLDFSQAPSSGAAWRTAFTFNGNATNTDALNTLALSGNISLGTKSTALNAQRRGMTLDLTGNITGSGGILYLNSYSAGFSTSGGAQGGVIRFSNRARSYTNAQTLSLGTLIIGGDVPASGNSPIGTQTITFSTGAGGNIVSANGQHGIRSIYLNTAGTTFARVIALTGGNGVTYNGGTFNVYNGYRLGGLNGNGTVTFSGNISSSDPNVGSSSANQTITLGQNLALMAADGGSVQFTGVISDTASANHTTRVTVNQFRNHSQLDTNANGVPDAGGAAGANANDAIGSPTGGTVVLSGNNTYAGGTEVLGGTLLASNAAGSATGPGPVTVQSGARLGGTGTISGPVTLAGGAGLAFTLGAAPGAHDKLDLGGSLAFAGNTTVTITPGGSTPAAGNYTLLTAGGGTGAGALPALNLPAGWAAALQRSGNNLVLVLTATALPAAPAGLTANATSGSQISLTWNASATATSYTVKRATVSGGPYTAVLPGLGTTSYTDLGLSPGTTYHYVVSAAHSGGEGANGSQASATTWTPLQTWRVGRGLALNAADAADPDGDGLSNFLEFALDRDPLALDPAAALTAGTDPSGRLRLTFLRARPASEATYRVLGSSDLLTWQPVTADNPGTVGGNVTVTDDPPAGASKRFLRLDVTTP